MYRPLILAALASFAAAGSAHAAAPAGNEKVNMVIIYGEDECPKPKGDEITVCARKAESERYRIPEPLRDRPSGPQSETWNSRVLAYEKLSASGAQSCSATGAGGWTGCATQFIHDAYAEKKAAPEGVQFSRMIEAEREKRAATLDAEAAQTQGDVEAAERAYDARKKAEAAKAKAPSAQ